MDQLVISKAQGTWVVRAFGSVIGESSNALVLEETGLNETIYFPREDIAMEFLEKSDASTHCPKKGDANYFGISTTEGLKPDTAWSYEKPVKQADRIKDYIAFYRDQVTVEQL